MKHPWITLGTSQALLATLVLVLPGCQASERAASGQSLLAPGDLTNASAAIIANNGGQLIGKVKGPTALTVSGYSSALPAADARGLRLQQADDLLELAAGASVEVTDARGAAISYGPVTTDAEGNFSFRKLKPSLANVYVTASYTLADRVLTLRTVALAPRRRGAVDATLTPASTLVVKKALEMVHTRLLVASALTADAVKKLTAAIAPDLDASTTAAAVLLDDHGAALAFDALLAANPALRDKLRLQVSKTPLADLVTATPSSPGPSPAAEPLPTPVPSPSVPHVPLVDHGVFNVAGTGQAGYTDGPGQAARFNVPYDVATDASGNLYVADSENHCVRKVAPDGSVSTLAGDSTAGFADGQGKQARFTDLSGVAVAKDGSLYVADYSNNAIRRVSPSGLVSTFAGNGEAGFKDGLGKDARFDHPTDLTLDAAGNLYVSDEQNSAVRKIAPDGTVTTLVGGGQAGFVDGAAASARLNQPSDVAIDVDGNLYIADTGNNAIRKLTPDGRLSTLAGNGEAGYVDGVGKDARFDTPYGLVVDDLRRVYVADSNNHRVRLITPDGTVSTFQGTGPSNFSLLGAKPGMFNLPSGAAIRRNARGVGEVYIADSYNHRICKFEVPIARDTDYLPK